MIILFDSKFKNPGSAMTSCIINDDVIKMSHFWVKLWYDMEGRWGGRKLTLKCFFRFFTIFGAFLSLESPNLVPESKTPILGHLFDRWPWQVPRLNTGSDVIWRHKLRFSQKFQEMFILSLTSMSENMKSFPCFKLKLSTKTYFLVQYSNV